MDMESLNGLTKLNIMEITSPIRRKDGEPSNGLISENMKDSGLAVSSQDQANLPTPRESQSLGCGCRENEKKGSRKKSCKRRKRST